MQEKFESLEIRDQKEVAVQFDYLISQSGKLLLEVLMHVFALLVHFVSDLFDTSVIVAGKKLFYLQEHKLCVFEWKNYGLRLRCPQGAASKNTEIAVTALASGTFKVPKGTMLVSAVYAISVSKPLLNPLMIEMQHCIDIRNTDQTNCLKFVRAPLKSYQFNIIDGGSFSVGNRYGIIERNQFCAMAIVAEMSNGDTPDGSEDGGGSDTEVSESKHFVTVTFAKYQMILLKIFLLKVYQWIMIM